MTEPAAMHRQRNRIMLFALFAIFVGSFVLAGALRFSGWRPEGLKNKGELLQPPADLRAMVPRLAQGGDYRWDPKARTWRILVAAPADCAEACVALSRNLDTVWRVFGRNADHVHTLWLGPWPSGGVRNASTRVLVQDAALVAALPRAHDAGGVPLVYVVDPNGFVILRYAPGFDPGDLRIDVARLLKLR